MFMPLWSSFSLGFKKKMIITISTAGGQNVNGAGRTHVSENMLDKGEKKKKKRTLKLDLEGLIK